jgi:hypothetical protein
MSESNADIHTRVGNNLLNWWNTGEQLFAASETLEDDRHYTTLSAVLHGQQFPTIFIFTNWIEIMLVAFGIECLIKAIWLKQGNVTARDGKYVPIIKDGERHDLVKLCNAIKFALNKQEVGVHERIWDIAGSISRYPIALRTSQNDGERSWSSEDDKIVERLIARLRDQLQPPQEIAPNEK